MGCPCPDIRWSHASLILRSFPRGRGVRMCLSKVMTFMLPCSANRWRSPFPPIDVGPNVISPGVWQFSPIDDKIEKVIGD